MPTLKKFLSSVEQKPSSIHGRGIFTKKAIKQGDYCSHGTQDIVTFVQEMTAVNSPLVPTWRDLLFGGDDSNICGEDNKPLLPLGERLAKFRSDFANFTEEEKSKANIIETIILSNDGRPTEMHVTTSSDISRGNELLRAYGLEWLSIKYYHLKANLLRYRASLKKDGSKKFMIFIDPTELFLQDAIIWEDNGMGLSPADAEKLMSEQSGKDIRHISLEELNSSANLLGMLAHENFGKGGNWLFDSSWKNTQAQLKEEEDQTPKVEPSASGHKTHLSMISE
mmetsp:Transcript_28541/g.51575  ORF Transcript_28541/g.51575 Transcript_28541/m.51575 type:complete len:281 (+) Transcript_28541:81-923(+)